MKQFMKVTDLVEAIKADLPKKNKLEKIAAVFSHFSPSQFGGSLNTFRFISFSTIDKKPE